ncbi:MAG TPA: shikimate kinase [Gemmatimonadaceae bacterium]|nr:shikimate kinase [Gemmatimonadaceae bacterium]
MPVFLIGLPGAGKSTIGQAVAAKLHLPFVDLDRDIESAAGKSIERIFLEDGEPRFREMEAEATARIPRTPAIVAPGAGWISNEAVRVLVRHTGPAIYLRVEPRTAASRLGAAVADRPLLAGDPVERLERLLADRRELYESADASVDTELYPFEEVVQRTAELASAFLRHQRE